MLLLILQYLQQNYFSGFFNLLPQQEIFRLIQIDSICRRIHKYGWKIKISFGKGRKHCGKRRKCWLPAFSPFPTLFSKRLPFQGRWKSGSCGKGLTHFHTVMPFDAPGKQAFSKDWEKEKLLITSNFSFTHSVFYPFRELLAIFIKFKIIVCRPFQFRPV